MNDLTDTSTQTIEKCAKVSKQRPSPTKNQQLMVCVHIVCVSQTIDDLMDLMQRCIFLAPLSNFQDSLTCNESSSTPVKQVQKDSV